MIFGWFTVLALWVDDVIEFSDGSRISADPMSILAYSLRADEESDVYFYRGERQLEAWMIHMLHAFVPKHTGGRNTFNVLCGVNRILYHATYTNSDGVKFRVMTFSNLIPTPDAMLSEEFGGNGGPDSAMRAIRMADDMGIHGITIGSFSMQNFRQNFGVKKYFEKFPALEERDLTVMRGGYMGGFVMAIPGDYGRCVDMDCNGLHSSILRDDFLPWGYPEKYEGAYMDDDDMPYHIDVMTFRADLKPDGYAFLSSPHFAYSDDRDRMVSTHGYITMPLTDVDQELLRENYDVSVYEYGYGWKFRRSKGFFADWVDMWDEMKEHSSGGRRTLAKWVPNSMVGKFGTVPRGSCLEPELDDDDGITWTVRDYGRPSSSYLPVAMYVTSLARRHLMKAMRRQSGTIVYANTDGFMLQGRVGDVKGLDMDGNRTGAWKTEGDYRRVRILGPGLYQGERTEGGIDLISSGVTRNTPIPWDEFREGSHILDDFGNDIVL